ncbi:MAG: hypothetical protein AAB353_08675, partial [Candidatus Hydrogenedentota bacterium]
MAIDVLNGDAVWYGNPRDVVDGTPRFQFLIRGCSRGIGFRVSGIGNPPHHGASTTCPLPATAR